VADGTGAAWYRRDPRLFRALGRRGLILHLRLRRRWPRLAAQYRAAAAELTSPQRWRETFASAGQAAQELPGRAAQEPPGRAAGELPGSTPGGE
jgi:galactofuranosylgalactofuranosylrhamnosyl-N-acetylglucosaminyl-diphospho-decaprenol beta-1,5/1,6-galactofuranosyltransferase